MKKIIYILVSTFILLNIINTKLYADEIANYIILNDIAPYQRLTKTIDPDTEELKTIPGYWIYRNAGVLIGTDHFQLDHVDVTYKTKYQSETIDIGIVVQVTQHAGSDSDRWLLHELDAEFRTYYGIPDLAYTIKTIDGNRIFVDATGGRDYRWTSGTKVIKIEYTDLQMTKPQPLEVVQAYLAKHPSTIPAMTLQQLRSDDNVIKWIKDEIERRLWLCDKWNAQYNAGKATQADLIDNLVRSMKVFLNYREKYYSVATQANINALSGYQENNNIASIQTKLSEYKGWWVANKAQGVTLP